MGAHLRFQLRSPPLRDLLRLHDLYTSHEYVISSGMESAALLARRTRVHFEIAGAAHGSGRRRHKGTPYYSLAMTALCKTRFAARDLHRPSRIPARPINSCAHQRTTQRDLPRRAANSLPHPLRCRRPPLLKGQYECAASAPVGGLIVEIDLPISGRPSVDR